MSIVYDFKAINADAKKISSHMLWPDSFAPKRELPPFTPVQMAPYARQVGEMLSFEGKVFYWDGSEWLPVTYRAYYGQER